MENANAPAKADDLHVYDSIYFMRTNDRSVNDATF